MFAVNFIPVRSEVALAMQNHSSTPDRLAAPSLALLFQAEESPLVRFAFGLVGRRAVAEELVQEAFLQLHRHWAAVENPRGWLYRSVRNLGLNHLRDHRREEMDAEAGVTSVDEREAPDAELARLETAGVLRSLVEELAVEDRQLIQLKYEERLSYGRISEQTGLSVGNVGYRLHHVLKGLAESLRRAGIEGIEG